MTFTNEKCGLAAGRQSWGVLSYSLSLSWRTTHGDSALCQCCASDDCLSRTEEEKSDQTGQKLHPDAGYSVHIILFLFLGVPNTNDSIAKTTCIFVLDRKEAWSRHSSWATSYPPTLPLDRPPVSQSLKSLLPTLKLGWCRDLRKPKQDLTIMHSSDILIVMTDHRSWT